MGQLGFDIAVLIHDIIHIPFGSGVLFIKVKPPGGTRHEFTKHRAIVRDRVTWEESFRFTASMSTDKTGYLESCVLRLSVRKVFASIVVAVDCSVVRTKQTALSAGDLYWLVTFF